jgi:hypothetical protein
LLKGKRILVTGGRYFNLADEVDRILRPIHLRDGIAEVGEGWATGADELCRLWALAHGIPVASYEANWKLLGNAAGSARNSRMLREFKPDLGVAFPGGEGTKDMVRKLLFAGVPTIIGRFSDATEKSVSWKLLNGKIV